MKKLSVAIDLPLAARWQALLGRYQGLAARERMLINVGVAAVALMLADQCWLTPSWKAWTAARQAQQQAATVLQSITNDTTQLEQRKALNTQQMQAELTTLQARVNTSQARSQTRDLVSPAEMLPLLEKLLSRQPGLKVVGLQSLGQTTLGDGSPAIHRHSVELTVAGSYGDLLAYLHTLEASPQRLLWGSLQLKVEQHPQVVLTLRLHTLSTAAGWVEI